MTGKQEGEAAYKIDEVGKEEWDESIIDQRQSA